MNPAHPRLRIAGSASSTANRLGTPRYSTMPMIRCPVEGVSNHRRGTEARRCAAAAPRPGGARPRGGGRSGSAPGYADHPVFKRWSNPSVGVDSMHGDLLTLRYNEVGAGVVFQCHGGDFSARREPIGARAATNAHGKQVGCRAMSGGPYEARRDFDSDGPRADPNVRLDDRHVRRGHRVRTRRTRLEQPSGGSTFADEVQVTVVNVDVYVRDRKGRPGPEGLDASTTSPSSQDGVEMPISNFAELTAEVIRSPHRRRGRRCSCRRSRSGEPLSPVPGG